MSLMCNFGVRSRFLDVIYGVRPPNGSPDVVLLDANTANFGSTSLALTASIFTLPTYIGIVIVNSVLCRKYP